MPGAPTIDAFSLADLGLAAVVGVVALVPAAMAFLALAAGLRAVRAEQRLGPVAFRGVAGGLAACVAVGSALLAWIWGGATHLKPRCLARSEPVYASTIFTTGAPSSVAQAIPVAAVLIDAPDFPAAPPAWAAALLGPGGFAYYEWRRADGSLARVDRDGNVTPIAAASAGALLRVRRTSVQSSYWARITADRFTLTELATNIALADGEEMWVDAGPARYRCGIASGPLPVAGADYPAGDGVAHFIRKAVVPLR